MALDFTSAESIIRSYLNEYGLEDMTPWALTVVQQNPNIDQATFAAMLYERPEFKARFPAFDVLRSQGKGISVAAYREYENTLRETLHSWGIPQEMYGSRQDIADLLINDVSASEANYRIQRAAEAAFTAPQETRDALRDLYGIDGGGLIAYWLDPDKAQPILERQYAAAKIAGAAQRQDIAVGVTEAERLAALGVTEAEANQGFVDVAARAGLQSGMGETVTQSEVIDARFGDAAAATKVNRVTAGRVGQFQGGGGAQESSSGVTGLGRSGV